MGAALDGVRVLDLTHLLTGPYATRFLADYGADVIKIEPPGGEPGRWLAPFQGGEPDPERSGVFFALNLNKRGVVLDLRRPAGRDALLRMAAGADLVVDNFRPGVLERLGIGYEALREANERVVLLSVSNFGQTGPYRDYKGSETILYGMGGEMFSVGRVDREPLKQGGTVALFQAGGGALVAAMAGIMAARRFGIGQWIDFSIYEALASSADRRVMTMMAYAYSGQIATRQGEAVFFSNGIFPCADGYVELFAEQTKWDRFVRMLGDPPGLLGPRWREPGALSDAALKEEFDVVFYPWLMTHKKRDIWRLAAEHSILAAPLYTARDLLDDPVFRERGAWAEVEHGVMGRVTVAGRAFDMSDTPWRLRRPAPLLGEHTEEVLAEAGLTPEMIRAVLGEAAA
jgi:crotonobetainyl-CoA:carnitine CoA-transferase CaiB-like acyl-CoA transferase